jgi:acyl-coenzyme A synthetase/AMP-(fatty) acid ligase
MDVLESLNQLGKAENCVLWQAEDGKTQISLKDMRVHLAGIHQKLAKEEAQNWLLYSENPCHFCIGFLALLGLNKKVIICANKQAAWLGLVDHHIDAVLSDEDLGLTGIQNVDFSRLPDSASAWWPHLDGFEEVLFLTSGTTGEPKFISKNLRALTNEVSTLASAFPLPSKEVMYCASVSYLHIYGLLFGLLLPLTSGCRSLFEPIKYPEQLQKLGLHFKNLIFISSPAFLSRLDLNLPPLSLVQVFSSGGPLTFNAAQNAQKCFGTLPVEVYGSTETGGIAYRQQLTDSMPWQPFSGVTLVQEEDDILVSSPNMPDQTPYTLDDKLQILDDGLFLLQGRKDRIVKVEEKRISLTEIERFLTEQENIVQCVALVLKDGGDNKKQKEVIRRREIIGCVIVLDSQGLKKLKSQGQGGLVQTWKAAMHSRFEAVAIPRKWRIVHNISLNTQGKIDTQTLLAHFQKANSPH